MEREPGGGQGWPAILREGTAYGTTIATHDLRFGVCAPFQFAFNRPDATHPLFQRFLGMAVGFIDRLGGFTQIMEMTQLVRHGRQDLGHGSPDGGLAISDDPDYGYLERLLHLAQEYRQIVLGRRQQTPSQEDLPGETITQDPEDFMAHVGLEAIERQDDVTSGLRKALQAERILQREGHQFVITLQEMGDRPWGYGHAALDQRLMDFRDTPVVTVALLANEGHDIQAKFMLGECQTPLLFRPIGLATLRTSGVEAAPNLERESQDRCQGGDGTVVMVGGPHHLTTG